MRRPFAAPAPHSEITAAPGRPAVIAGPCPVSSVSTDPGVSASRAPGAFREDHADSLARIQAAVERRIAREEMIERLRDMWRARR